MPINVKSLQTALKKAKEDSKKRKFRQSVELIVNLRGIDLKKPEFRLNELVTFPNPLPIEVKLCVIATGELALRARDAGVKRVIEKEELPALGGNRVAVKKIAKECNTFIALAELMPLVGKNLGPVLAPRGKMPRPVPANVDIKAVISQYKSTGRVQLKKEPIVKIRIGTEDMTDEQLAQNAMQVFHVIENKLQRGLGHVRSVYVKQTMGPAISVDVR
ncbi:MAG: 50S ribosomal protein L1 [Candidatus Ranarchaeia archaeon]